MGGGGGGGGGYRTPSPEAVESAADQLGSEFLPDLGEILQNVLSIVNNRDGQMVNARKDALLEQLKEEFDSVSILYGGSVAKYTYVEGLSDVDALLIVDMNNGEGVLPEEIKDIIVGKLEEYLPADTKTESGKVAVTITYADGMELQLIPTLREGGQMKVPSWKGTQWSKIDPDAFQKALSKSNEDNGMKLVPTIKLAKAVLAASPLGQQISGYHVEAMAIDAFKGDNGAKTLARMLPRFFERAAETVKSPIKDMSGQSVNVDTYLGVENSKKRREMSHVLEAIARRMKAATVTHSKSTWTNFFKEVLDK